METFEERFSFSEVMNAMWAIFARVANRESQAREIGCYIALKELAAKLLAGKLAEE